MLVTMLTAMYMLVKAGEQLGVRWVREQEPLPYLVSQPLPWQVHNVSHSRRGSRSEESGHKDRDMTQRREHIESHIHQWHVWNVPSHTCGICLGHHVSHIPAGKTERQHCH